MADATPELEVVELSKNDGLLVTGTTNVGEAKAAIARFIRDERDSDRADWLYGLIGRGDEDLVWAPVWNTGNSRLDIASSDPEFHTGAVTFTGVWFQ